MLLHLMAGSKEDAETVTAFFEDMKMRGLNDPLLEAIEVCFPRAALNGPASCRKKPATKKVHQ